MPVPKRRKPKGGAMAAYNPLQLLNLLDIHFMFTKTRSLLLYGFAPTVIVMGMFTEPAPASWLELINIW